jgi:hypothetical protein
LIKCAIDPLLGFDWTRREKFRSRLEAKQKALKTLQQSVMQFARNACTLTYPRLQGPIELRRELPDTELITRPQQD